MEDSYAYMIAQALQDIAQQLRNIQSQLVQIAHAVRAGK